ncbi:DUF4019 domain-containing protein [Burkholderia vietnamiensis]|uniref:DUF4019 domain-containing protein n=1 Tax=Burkholderia vietnamiensis TaxID=60552 RepID=UPI0007598AAF|nr:DUF4019 domain-containing protein [Burkholderia vietnamiensis]KVE73864.1 hypothetical protein WI98_18315 [Burkholderia vietnamiensis]
MNAHPPLSRAKWLIGCAAASLAIGAHAQAGGESADALLRDADTVFKQLDAGQYGTVWADSAAFVKARIKQDQFAADVQRARQSVGTVRHRGWAQITRIRYTNAGTTPDGLYANVDYATTLTTGTTVYEKLSFRLEDDGLWHLTGYVPRQSQNYAP